MHRYIIRVVLLASLLGPIAAWGLTLDSTDGIHKPIRLSGHLAARCVEDGNESVETVASHEHETDFVELPQSLHKGYTSNTCWQRFELQRAPDAPKDWLLEVGTPYLDDVTLFIPTGNSEEKGRFQSIRLGDRFPYSERPIPYRHFVFPFLLPEVEPVTFYLRIQTTSTMLVDTINVWQPPGLLQAAQREGTYYGLGFGIITLGFLSNVVFWIWLREGIYGSYAIYLLSLLILNLVGTGIATQQIWSHLPILADRAVGLTAVLIFLAGLSFFDEVLGLQQNFPPLRRVIPTTQAFYVACCVMAAVGNYATVAPVVQVVALVGTIGITMAGPWLIWRGKHHLRLYVLAFSTQLIVAIAMLSRNLGWWPLEITVDQFAIVATALHVVLLNLALAERVRHAHYEKLNLEKTAARLQVEQSALEEQKGFMAMVAHEFRTPLTIIDTSAQRIAGRLATGEKKTLERCSNIRTAVQRLIRLMDEFLTIDRLEGKVSGFTPVPCHADEITNAVLTEFPPKRIEVRLSHTQETLIGDPALLRVALANLISNALRFSPPNHLVRVAVERKDHGAVVFSVSDDGPGIPSDERLRLFEKFFRGRNNQGQPGAGLGLYLVEHIAKLHGGTVHCSSSPGKETRFSLTIPSSTDSRQHSSLQSHRLA